MANRDATELYLADLYAQAVPEPEQQLAWARGMDAAQQQINRALAASAEAVAALLDAAAENRPDVSAARMLARVLARADAATADESPAAFLRVCMRRLRTLVCRAGERDAEVILDVLQPLRLRTEFLSQLTARLRATSSEAEAFIQTAGPALARIGELTGLLVNANQRLVATLARQYRNGPLPFMDLVQEGNLGLLRALERFDPEHGTRVSTYAMWWIRRAMVYAIARQGRDVRPSVAQYWGARQALRAMDRLEIAQGRRATHREAALHLGTSVEALQQSLALLSPPLALDAPLPGPDGAQHLDRLESAAEKNPEPMALEGDLRHAVRQLLLQLPERHAKILRMR
ncbi:MAG: sigma-70 family RNA polymerase sigma factor, partial [Thiohalobacteraceae bacterium]